MAGLSITLLVAIAGLVVHMSQMYVVKLREQRTADLASLAAANQPNAISDGAPSAAALETAQNVAELNGFSAAGLSLNAVNGGTQLKVNLSKTQTSVFRGGLGASSGTVVNSASTATPALPAGTCVITTSNQIDVLSSGTLTGSSCAVTSKTYMSVNRATVNVRSVAVGYSRQAEAFYVDSPVSITPALSSFTYSKTLSDPLAGTAAINNLDKKLSSMAMGWPYPLTSPVTVSLIPVIIKGSSQTYHNATMNVAGGARFSKLVVDGSTLTFLGSGLPDPTCSNPTTVSGTTSLMNGPTLAFSSGCYVFQGDLELSDSSSATFKVVNNAVVRFVFGSSINVPSSGWIYFPTATYSVALGVAASGGGVKFSGGSKVVGGAITNVNGSLDFGPGPTYLTGTSVTNTGGSISFGDGATYFYSTALTNAAGTVSFGKGALYAVSSIVNNTGRSATMTFAGGTYAWYLSTFGFNDHSVTTFGPGNFDLYWSSLFTNGGSLTITGPNASVAGSASLSLLWSAFTHSAGSVTATGVTFALRNSTLSLADGLLSVTAPTGASPTYGTQNLLVYSQDNDIYFSSTGRTNVISGLLYAPQNRAFFTYGGYGAGSGCLAIVAGGLTVDLGATVTAVPCSNYSWSLTGVARAQLKN